MLWTVERTLTDYEGGKHIEYDIHITRGDSGYLEVIPKQSGANYTPTGAETIALHVRAKPVRDNTETALIFAGNVTAENGVPVWHITSENTTINCCVYYWDAQLTSGEEVCTYAMGRLFIEEECTL